MPRLIPIRLAAACVPALLVSLGVAGSAVAKGTPAGLRVVAGQQVMIDKTLKTGTTAVPTSPQATCFGAGSVGSGKKVRVAGPTPLGLLAQAARTHAALRPLRVTDAFSFGLGLCAIGGRVPTSEGYWQLRVNHVAPSVGGDAVRLEKNDAVLWYLTASFPAPPELWLKAPKRVKAGKAFRARVFSYGDDGRRKPAAGVKVRGTRKRTNKRGIAVVKLRKPLRLIARDGRSVPSNRVPVCVGRRCPGGSR